MKKQLTILPLLVALLFGIVISPAMSGQVTAAPARSHPAAVHTQEHSAAFDKSKFLLHLGVAAFLIHYIYKKYQAGTLSRRHIFTVVKSGAAALIAYHELRTAYSLAQGSNSKTLHVLISPLTKLSAAVSDLGSKLKHGDTSTVNSTYGQSASFDSLAGKNGYAVKEIAPSGGPGF